LDGVLGALGYWIRADEFDLFFTRSAGFALQLVEEGVLTKAVADKVRSAHAEALDAHTNRAKTYTVTATHLQGSCRSFFALRKGRERWSTANVAAFVPTGRCLSRQVARPD